MSAQPNLGLQEANMGLTDQTAEPNFMQSSAQNSDVFLSSFENFIAQSNPESQQMPPTGENGSPFGSRADLNMMPMIRGGPNLGPQGPNMGMPGPNIVRTMGPGMGPPGPGMGPHGPMGHNMGPMSMMGPMGPVPVSMMNHPGVGPGMMGPAGPRFVDSMGPIGMSDGRIYPPDQNIIKNPSNPNAPAIYPCGICHKEVQENDQAILCESGCNFWFHRVCTGLSHAALEMLHAEIYAEWVCDKCLNSKNIPLVKMKH